MRMPCWLLVPLLACTACTWPKRNDRVLITSEPAGARVFLDGHDTRETTPVSLDIAGNFGSDHELELRRKGYRTERRHLTQYTEGYTSRWIEGADGPEIVPLFVFWTIGDFLFPFGVHGAIVPGEVYVVLHREGEPLLGFDLLEQKRREAAAATTVPTTGNR